MRTVFKTYTWKWCNKNALVHLSAAVSFLIYVCLIPSAQFFYEYIPSSKIGEDIYVARNVTVDRIPACPLIPLNLDKSLPIDLLPNMSPASAQNVHGGAWKPTDCVSRYHVAIIIPYRNRESHLQIFLKHMHGFLQSQLLDYRIVLVEQSPEKQFNRAALFNIGFLESRKISDFSCFIFHDVDLLPMNSANMYVCSSNPRHMSVAVSSFRFALPYPDIFGGVVAMTYDQFTTVNGFSNEYYGWGGEDDEIIIYKGLKISRWDPRISRYFMLPHAKEIPNSNRRTLMARSKGVYATDGINSVSYEVISKQQTDLVTRILVKL